MNDLRMAYANVGAPPLIHDAVDILASHTIMSISTLRPDGWPQTTIVGFANDGLTIYFLIFRSSQKFANIQHDNRVSIAVGGEPQEIGQARAVFAGAYASEVIDSDERITAWQLLKQRHPNLAAFEMPESSQTAIMRADCKYVSVVDYTKGLGHTESLTIGVEAGTTAGHRRDEWAASISGGPSEETQRKV